MSRITLEKSPFRLDRLGCPPYDGVREGAVPVKKRWKILLVCVVVLAVIAAWCFIPRPAVGEDFKIHYVEAGDGMADVTDKVDLEALGDLLRDAKRMGYHNGAFTRIGKRCVIILGMEQERPVHIYLDEGTYLVDYGDFLGMHPLLNGEDLLDQVWSLLPEP